ncbi:hypothetical protein [Microcoleus sp.]
MQYSPTPLAPLAKGGDKNTVALFFEIGIRGAAIPFQKSQPVLA